MNIEVIKDTSNYNVNIGLPNETDRLTIKKVVADLNIEDSLIIIGDDNISYNITIDINEYLPIIVDGIEYCIHKAHMYLYRKVDSYYDMIINYSCQSLFRMYYFSVILHVDCSYYSYEETLKYIINNIWKFYT